MSSVFCLIFQVCKRGSFLFSPTKFRFLILYQVVLTRTWFLSFLIKIRSIFSHNYDAPWSILNNWWFGIIISRPRIFRIHDLQKLILWNCFGTWKGWLFVHSFQFVTLICNRTWGGLVLIQSSSSWLSEITSWGSSVFGSIEKTDLTAGKSWYVFFSRLSLVNKGWPFLRCGGTSRSHWFEV